MASVGLALAAGASVAGATEAKPVAGIEPTKAVENLDEPPYEAGDRRDPFRPPRVSAAAPRGEAQTPLERYDIGQLRLVAVIYDTREPRAVVEDEAGLGYIVRVGTRIGSNGGSVDAIEDGRLRVLEQVTDFYGDTHSNEAVMELKTVGDRPKDANARRGSR